jgi:hypothetical protein
MSSQGSVFIDLPVLPSPMEGVVEYNTAQNTPGVIGISPEEVIKNTQMYIPSVK